MDRQPDHLGACHCCGLVHRIPPIGSSSVACCSRCQAVIKHGVHPRSVNRAAALALGALILYPLALWLPVMEIERLGHTSAASIWSGTVALLAEGHLFVGLAVLVFSVIAPIAKLGLIFALCVGQGVIARQDRARAYRLIELIGRWGMVDVLLVAILVAVVKLGDLVQVTPGAGVVVFGVVVILSLLASAAFDPHAIWEENE
ncbi:MAG: paraquat-inducible protein A [Phycisphaerales bacterium]